MDLSEFVNIIEAVKTPLSYLVLVTLVVTSLGVYFFKGATVLVKASAFGTIYFGFMAAALFLLVSFSSDNTTKIVFMDSTVKANIYDRANKAKGIINSHLLRDIVNSIEGINAVLIVEPTNFEWKYEDNIIKMNPDLIVIHYSAFEIETVGHNDDRAKSKFRSFLRYFRDTKCKFLIYTRGGHFESGGDKQKLFEETGIAESRFLFYKVPNPYTFTDPTIERDLKLLVKDAMGLSV